MRLTKALKQAITEHARSTYPNECCGLIIDDTYHPCDNVAPNPNETFELDPAQYVDMTAQGDLQAIVHSHPNGSSAPSELDRVQMSLHGVDWVICGYGYHAGGDEYVDIARHAVKPYQAPLVGREYYHGAQDCYSLVRDYYSRELGIELPDFERIDAWWESAEHAPLYQDNFAKAGFVQLSNDIGQLQAHDVILCRVGRTYHVNHALIYLGTHKLVSEQAPAVIGDNLVLHHPHGRLSVRELYGDSWQRRTAMVVRHKSLVS